MHPTLDLPGPASLPTYGVLLAVGFLAGLVVVWRLAPRAGLDRLTAVELASALVLGGVLGSRLAFAVLQWRELAAGDWGVLVPWRAGHVFYGGLLGGVTVLLLYRRRLGVGLGELGDLYIPGVALAHVAGRLGCLNRKERRVL